MPTFGQRGKGAFEHQRPSPVVGRQVDRHTAAQRAAHEHDPPLGHARPSRQPGPRGTCVGHHARLAGRPLAAPVAAIVEDQQRQSDAIVQDPHHVGPVGEVSGIAMAVEHDRPGRLLGKIPTVQSHAIGRGEPGILERQRRGIPVALRKSGGKEDQRFLEVSIGIEMQRGRPVSGTANLRRQGKDPADQQAAEREAEGGAA